MKKKIHSDFILDTASFSKFKDGNIQDYYDIEEQVIVSVMQPIGVGGYAVVFRAKEKQMPLGSWRAIKTIPKQNIVHKEQLMN